MSKTDRNGSTTVYTHDALNRILSESVTVNNPSGSLTSGITHTYTKTGQKLTERNGIIGNDESSDILIFSPTTIPLASPAGSKSTLLQITNKYDAMGRLINQTESDGTVKTFANDANGNRTSFVLTRTDKQEIDLSYVYDALNRLTEVKKGATVIAKYAYDDNGNRSLLEYPQNGIITSYAYNDANLVTSLENKRGTAVLSSFRYTYYLDGNQKDKTDHKGIVTSYLYDSMGRLTQESETGGKTIAYAYDRFSNRSKMTVTGTQSYTTTYEYHPNNWLLKEEKRQGETVKTTRYRYDANGNQVYREWEKDSPKEVQTGRVGFVQDSFMEDIATLDAREYNGFNQLISVYRDGVRSQYSYRPDGLRYSKTVKDRKKAESIHIHLWDGQNMVAEVGTTNTVTARYLRGINLIAREQDGVNQYYLFNAHGDVVQRYDALGNLLKNYKYDAYGNEENPEPLDSNPFRYCGEYFDEETGEIYLRARYYDPATGRFGAEDPARHGLNWYTYCGGNPIALVDPSGMSFVDNMKSYFKKFGHDAKSFWNKFSDDNSKRFNKFWKNKNISNLADYLSYGYFSANQARYSEADDICGYTNWALSGVPDMLNGTFNPDEPLSFDHWMNSLGTATLVYSGYKTVEGVLPQKTFHYDTRYNPVNPGPLSNEVATSFRSATYTQTTLQKSLTLYRSYGGNAGQVGRYLTDIRPQGPLQATIDSALYWKWGNNATQVTIVRVPAGTTLYYGCVAPQGGLVGGGAQYFVPNVNPSWFQ